MMARVVIRKPEIPCFVLNSQVRVADWEQVSGTHQGQRQISKPRSKAGHRTVLTNRVINAFYPCNADAIHTGQTGLVQVQLLLTQHLFVFATNVGIFSPRGPFWKPLKIIWMHLFVRLEVHPSKSHSAFRKAKRNIKRGTPLPMTIDSKKQMKFIRQIEQSSDISNVWELAQAGLRTFGFEFFIYLTVEPDFSDPFCLSNLPKLFLEAPPEEDPFLRYCCDHYEFTFTGADYLDEYEYLPDSARAYITAARELGFYSGFGVPVQLRGSTRFGGLNLGTSLPRHRFENEFLSLQQDIRFFCLITHRKIEQLIQKKPVSKSWDFRGLISAPESEAAKLLTSRELEVVHHIGQGLSRKECAIVLGISHNTVSDYVKSAYRKLGVKNRVGASQRISR